jgi:ATP-dependent Lon protease
VKVPIMQANHHTMNAGTAAPFGRSWRRADRDLLRQIVRIRHMIADLAQPDVRPKPKRQLFAASDMKSRLDWARQLRGDAQKMIRGQLDHASSLGAWRTVTQAPLPAALEQLHEHFPNFGSVTSLIQRHLSLCQRNPDRVLRLPPMLLTGEPGVGKTAYARQLAQLLGAPMVDVTVSALSAGFSLAGLDASYESSKPGQIWHALDVDCMSPVVVLDEIDKPPRDDAAMLGCLYPLLERHTARRFIDQAVLLPVDASYITWVATCNDLARVEPALRSRFEIMHVEAPSKAQMPFVIASVQRELINEIEWEAGFDHELSDGVMSALTAMTPRELKRALEGAYAAAAQAGRDRIAVNDIVPPTNQLRRATIGFLQ